MYVRRMSISIQYSIHMYYIILTCAMVVPPRGATRGPGAAADPGWTAEPDKIAVLGLNWIWGSEL